MISNLLLAYAALKPFPRPSTREERLAMIPVQGLPLERDVVIYWNDRHVPFIAQKASAERQVRQSLLFHRVKEDSQLNDGLIDTFVRIVQAIRSELKTVTLDATESEKSVWTYGASAEGSTLLNYVGLTDQHVLYCADSTPIKHGLFLPQSNVEVRPEQNS